LCDHSHIRFKTVLKIVNKQKICNTHWEVLLLVSKQVNYNQVVVKCYILQEQNFNMQKFQNMEPSNSRTFQGLLKDPMNPGVIISAVYVWRLKCSQFQFDF